VGNTLSLLALSLSAGGFRRELTPNSATRIMRVGQWLAPAARSAGASGHGDCTEYTADTLYGAGSQSVAVVLPGFKISEVSRYTVADGIDVSDMRRFKPVWADADVLCHVTNRNHIDPHAGDKLQGGAPGCHGGGRTRRRRKPCQLQPRVGRQKFGTSFFDQAIDARSYSARRASEADERLLALASKRRCQNPTP